MLEMRAKVVEVSELHTLVLPLDKGGCSHCSKQGGCGGQAMSRLFCRQGPQSFRVINTVNAQVGDEVMVVLPDGELLRSVIKIYVLPLTLILCGAVIGAWLADEPARDLYAVLGAAAGLVFGLWLAKQNTNTEQQANISEILNAGSEIKVIHP